MRSLGAAWNSLGARAAVMTAGVSIAAIVVMGWYFTRIGVRALDREMRSIPSSDLEAIAEQVASAIQGQSLAAAAPVLHAAAGGSRQLAIFDSARRLVLVEPERLRGVAFRFDANGSLGLDGAQLPDSVGSDGVVIHRRRGILVPRARAAPINHDGHLVGTVVEIPHNVAPPGADFLAVEQLRRSMLVGIAVAIAGSVLLAVAFARRLVGPLEQLTDSARSVTASAQAGTASHVVVSGSREIRELGDAFNAMLTSLGREEALRRSMTSDVAHELRTPLTNVRCHIEALQDGLDAPTPETLQSLHEEILLLQRLVDDLQDLTLADQGRLRLEIAEVDIADDLRIAIRPFAQRASAANVALELNIVPNPPRVAADRARLRQIVFNLVSNALRYTSSGGGVAIEAKATADGFVVFSVRDSGAGIAPQDLPNVFERFYRADPARTRATGGAGLGLAIVKHLVTAMGGTVGIESHAGLGTTVFFTLPVAHR